MRRHKKQDRDPIRALRGSGPGPETFYDSSRRPAAALPAVAAAGLAVLVLALSGVLTAPRDADGPGEEEEPGARAHRRFLADLLTHRPAGENVVASGVSRPGPPLILDTQPFTTGMPHRIAYRCQGPGPATVTVTALASDGTGRRFPPVACGPAIASLALEEHRSVTLSGDGHGTLLLWAITTTHRTPPHDGTAHP